MEIQPRTSCLLILSLTREDTASCRELPFLLLGAQQVPVWYTWFLGGGGHRPPSEMEGSEAATWAQRPAEWLSDSRILLKNQESGVCFRIPGRQGKHRQKRLTQSAERMNTWFLHTPPPSSSFSGRPALSWSCQNPFCTALSDCAIIICVLSFTFIFVSAESSKVSSTQWAPKQC